MFCCTLLYVHSSIAIILMGKKERELVALLNLSSWCLMMVEWLFLAVPLGCLRFAIVVFPDRKSLNYLGPKITLLYYWVRGTTVPILVVKLNIFKMTTWLFKDLTNFLALNNYGTF